MVAFLALRKSSTTFMSTNKRDLIIARTAILYGPGAKSAGGSTGAFSIWLHATQRDEEIIGKPRGTPPERYHCLGNQKTTQPVAIFGSCSRDRVFAVAKVREGALQPDAIRKLGCVSRHYSSSSDSKSIKSFKTATTVDTVHTIATIDTFRTATTIETFHTASTVKTFHTAHSRQQPLPENSHRRDFAQQAAITSSWLRFLSEKHLIPHIFYQNDWSGRGQHVEFKSDKDALVGELLQAKGVLGHTASAVVEKVRCRRIILARKTIRCNRRLKREEAIEEVAHLQRLSHAHVIRGVGTYVLRKDLAILLYPATRHNLETFLDECVEFSNAKRLSLPRNKTLQNMLLNTRRFFECLTSTLGFIHGRFVKHMDIKPSNILVQDKGWRDSSYEYKIYIADFGISRSYAKAEDAETDSYTPFSRVYAAPEVIRQDQRGFSADIFSLGCVFLELLAVLRTPMGRNELRSLRQNGTTGDHSYQANMQNILQYSASPNLDFIDDRCYKWLETIRQIVNEVPKLRPSANDLKPTFGTGQDCCFMAPEAFEATGKEFPLDRSPRD
ncbi:kinase-like domain-containing protein [Paraphoma chrysanthemicola]|uniref:Kinase-like domain-containing protein n=1 Tax=Paraphoma chrysanthemicola TaxID=798071 RepID=A0A8K0RED3_9PLEO|nr:kinase-like domain-containing protein [Paraphoma chrysanthemicola]